MRSFTYACVALAAASAACGCSHVYKITLTSEPTAAFIQLDGQNAGNTPLTKDFDFALKPSYVVTASMPGYFTEEVVVTGRSPAVRYGELRLVLMEDEAWKATTTSDATNAWLRIQVDPKLSTETVWQKLVDAVTSAYSSLEQMDNASLYLRSVATTRRFRGPKGQFAVRTRFAGSIAQKDPLVYKIRIEADVSVNGADWSPYGRIFKEDASLIDELQSRLGAK
jgi:hypothetical protein